MAKIFGFTEGPDFHSGDAHGTVVAATTVFAAACFALAFALGESPIPTEKNFPFFGFVGTIMLLHALAAQAAANREDRLAAEEAA